MKEARRFHYCRAPRSRNEKKAYYDAIEQGVYPRHGKKLRRNGITDSWDDVFVEKYYKRSWKIYTNRKKQYNNEFKDKKVCNNCKYWDFTEIVNNMPKGECVCKRDKNRIYCYYGWHYWNNDKVFGNQSCKYFKKGKYEPKPRGF